jgi:CRISPR-associated protein Cas1
MRTKDLHELPRFGDKLSYLYTEHSVVDREEKAIAIHQADGTTSVPAAALGLLILGPGTKITHAAVQALADNNCQIIWSGEHGVRFYAHGLGGARHSRNLIRQAQLVSNELTRLQVVVRMYCMRFREPVDPSITIQQLRGKEGVRVRQAYAEASKATGVPWTGRSYQRDQWNAADPVNRALSAGNACLYGLCHAAILSGGYSPALGFIHTGKQLSFVYDIADLYKADHTIPVAFDAAASGPTDIERQVRLRCRDRFRQSRVIERILPDIQKVLDLPDSDEQEDEYAEDEARPSDWWQPQTIPADMPLGRLLKLNALSVPTTEGGKQDGGVDRGTSDARSAG